MKFVTEGMTETQISVLRDALNSYADYCVECATKAKEINSQHTAHNWNVRGLNADAMAKGIDK